MPTRPPTDHNERRATVGVPLLPNSIPSRPRLIRLFEESLARTPLIIVRTAPGAGKTTAAADWAASSSSPVIWASIEDKAEAENSAGLWIRFLRSSRVTARPGSQFHVLTGRALADIDQGDPLREVLLRTIGDASPVTLVVDGMPADADPSFLQDIHWLLSRCEGFRAIVILSGGIVPERGWELHTIDVTHIEEDQLYLSLEEVSAQIDRHGSDLDPKLVKAQTFGHPFLVRTLLNEHSARPVGTPEQVAALVDSLVRTNVFKRLPGANRHREFLVKTSLAETLTVDLASKLTGRADAARVIGELVSMRILKDRGSGFFSYPVPALRALQKQLHESMPEEVPRLRSILIEHNIKMGNACLALELAVQNEDFATAADVAVRHQSHLIYDHAKCAVRVLGEVADSVMRRHLPLAITLGHVLSQTVQGRSRGEALLESALAGAENRNGRSAEERMISPFAQMIALRVKGRFTEAVRRVPATVEAFETSCETQKAKYAGTLVSAQIQSGLTLLLDGWMHESRAMLYQAASAPPSATTDTGNMACLGLLALTYAVDGNIKESENVLQEAKPLYRARSPEGRAHVPYLLARTWCLLERDDMEGASASVAEAELSGLEGELWPFTVAARTLTDVLTAPEAFDLQMMARAASSCRHRPVSVFGQSLLSGVLSLAHLAQGNLSKAASTVDSMKRDPVAGLTKARVPLAVGDFAAAGRLLPTEESAMKHSERAAVQRLLMLAAVKRHAGSCAEADDAQRQGQAILSRTGMGARMLMLPGPAWDQLRHGPELPAAADAVSRPAIPAMSAPVQLTAREAVVLKALAGSNTASAAAQQLAVSLNTVKAQSRSIYRKLGVGSLRDALNEAGRRGLI